MNDESKQIEIWASCRWTAVGGDVIPWTLAQDSCHARQREVMCLATIFFLEKETMHHSFNRVPWPGSPRTRLRFFVFVSWESNRSFLNWSLFFKATCWIRFICVCFVERKVAVLRIRRCSKRSEWLLLCSSGNWSGGWRT
jgi:hypothetical protein